MNQFAAPLPLQVICDMLGVPPSDEKQIFEWTNIILGAGDPEFGGTLEVLFNAALGMYEYAQQLGNDRLATPRDDLTSILMHAEVEGQRLTTSEFGSFFILLAVAGNETTRNAISWGMKLLTDHPDQRAAWQADPGLGPNAIEEIVRWASPVIHMRRTANEDTEIGGQPIAAGDKVVLWYWSGNRDETIFHDGHYFDITRGNAKEQMGYGAGGPHFCLGANLARREITLMFNEIFRWLPDLAVTSEPDRLVSGVHQRDQADALPVHAHDGATRPRRLSAPAPTWNPSSPRRPTRLRPPWPSAPASSGMTSRWCSARAGPVGSAASASSSPKLRRRRSPASGHPRCEGHGATVRSLAVGAHAGARLHRPHPLLRDARPGGGGPRRAHRGRHRLPRRGADQRLRRGEPLVPAGPDRAHRRPHQPHRGHAARGRPVRRPHRSLRRRRLRTLCRTIDPSLAEGVYAGYWGPNYETPAEIRAYRALGADLVGMSTVLEAIAARAAGMEVLGLSLVTNLAAGMAGPLGHEEVLAAGKAGEAAAGHLLAEVLARLP